MKAYIVSNYSYDSQTFDVESAFKNKDDAVKYILSELRNLYIEITDDDILSIENDDMWSCEGWQYVIKEVEIK